MTSHKSGKLKEGILTCQNSQGREHFWSSHQLILRDGKQRISHNWHGLSEPQKHKMSKVSLTALHNYWKYKVYQIYLTATTTMQGRPCREDQVLELFPDEDDCSLLQSPQLPCRTHFLSPVKNSITSTLASSLICGFSCLSFFCCCSFIFPALFYSWHIFKLLYSTQIKRRLDY